MENSSNESNNVAWQEQAYAVSRYMTGKQYGIIKIERGEDRAILATHRFVENFKKQSEKLAQPELNYALGRYMASDAYLLIASERGIERAEASISRNVAREIPEDIPNNHNNESFIEQYDEMVQIAEQHFRQSRLFGILTFERGIERAERSTQYYLTNFTDVINDKVLANQLSNLEKDNPLIEDKIKNYPVTYWKCTQGKTLLKSEVDNENDIVKEFVAHHQIVLPQPEVKPENKPKGWFRGFFNRHDNQEKPAHTETNKNNPR